MKRFLMFILILAIAVTFVSCKSKEEQKPQTSGSQVEEEIIEEPDIVDSEEEAEPEKTEDDKTENENKPAENKPAENKPAENKPAENKPAENKPAENKPAENKPAENKPVENKPAETPSTANKTLGNVLLADFKAKAASGMDAEAIAGGLLKNPAILFGGATNPVAPGDYLPGFDESEIKGFKSGVAFMPMIGSIPFVGYVFELDGTVGASEFISSLKKSANLRWLVCAEAEEMVAGSEGNKVFFVMCPKSLEE